MTGKILASNSVLLLLCFSPSGNQPIFCLTPGRSLSVSLASTKTLFLASNEVQWKHERTSTHPTTTHLHSCKMPKDLHSDEKRGPLQQHPRTMQAGRMVMGLGALHRCGVAVGEDFGGELQFLKCYKSIPVWNRRRTHHRPWIWPQGARESCCKGLSMRL